MRGNGGQLEQTVFLSAEWRHLALVNYEAQADLLQPLVPRGTELDRHHGRVFVSLVGFRFLDTAVLGCRIPGLRDFDEVNLRFYVRRQAGTELRRAVTFVREIVPSRIIAAVARVGYNEPYVALPMRSEVQTVPAGESTRVRYAWQSRVGGHGLEVEARGEPALPAPDSDEEFITEHYWGYTRQRDGRTMEYRVSHPTWRLRSASSVKVTGDMAGFYGGALGEVLAQQPVSAYLAEGSKVTVSRPVRIA